MIDYSNSVALITGAGSGIGAALARALAARGASIICADVNDEAAANIASEIGAGAHSLSCNLAQSGAASALIDQAHAIHGQLDLVCSNAGIGYSRYIAKEAFDEDTRALFEINLFAGLKLAKAYAQLLEQTQAQGRFIATASENSLSLPGAVSTGRMAMYAATKHALLIAMEWFRIEQEDGPLALHVLLPGAVYTPLVSANLPDPAKAPAELELIMPERCAEIALRGMDLELFYIPTQAHLLEDMQPRMHAVEQALTALGIDKTC